MKLLGLIDKHEVSNTVLLSGDVHTASAFSTPCSAVAGYNVIEYTSSGMTHTVNAIFFDIVNMIQDPLYSGSNVMMEKNFGKLKINPVKNKLEMQIVTINGTTHFNQEFDLASDFVHDKTNLGINRAFCFHAQSSSKFFLMRMIQFFRVYLFPKEWSLLLWQLAFFIFFYFLICLGISIVLKVLSLLVWLAFLGFK